MLFLSLRSVFQGYLEATGNYVRIINPNDEPARRLKYREPALQGPLRYSTKPVVVMTK